MRSPWWRLKITLIQTISGGSSPGSAVAVANGNVSFSLGTDTVGSARVPAALNNIVGLKATKGLLSCTVVVPACKSLDCVTLLTNTVDELNQLLAITVQQGDSWVTCFICEGYAVNDAINISDLGSWRAYIAST